MPAPSVSSSLLSWALKYERRLGAVLFAFGFITDFFTFGLLPIALVNYFFIAYLVLAAVCTLGAHYFAGMGQVEKEAWWRRTLSVICPLGAQYAFGGLLSGLVVFYAAHSFVAASWPFILLLGIVYFGNEYFRMYKHYLVFQTTVFFFTLYAYSIFGLPLFVHQIGMWVFLGSTFVAILLFVLFLWLLHFVNKKRFKEEFKTIRITSGTIVAVVGISYFIGLIPPIPLALADSGVYHSIVKSESGYRVTAEEAVPWWRIGAPTVHHVPGQYVYVYSAVVAPIRFGTNIAHRWERKASGSLTRGNVPGKGWITDSRVTFPISGGREGGYRGYSMRSNLEEGEWRVSVETENGQVIGRTRFDIEKVISLPPLHEETL